MTEENKHWRSKVRFFSEMNIWELEKAINEFCKDKFVVGIQYPELPAAHKCVAVVSYKVKEE